ncbi:MAG: conjugal transfer protein TraX [Lachnospiraceae bacterium]|nr:conjugal transfer protein TraX [Lachnospiraceae bacterium]
MKDFLTRWDSFVEKHGISGSTLKILAYFIMFIDHTAAMLIQPYAYKNVGNMPYESFERMSRLYDIMRGVGRIAFPIFCFLLVEGYFHTKNVYRYALSLFVMAIVSEPAFDLALYGKFFDPSYQNVAFTLLLSLVAIFCVDRFALNEKYTALVRVIIFYVSVGLCMLIAWLLKTDYSFKGVIAVVIMFLFHKIRPVALLAGEAIFEYEPTAFFSLIPLMLYNGKRGLKIKYLFYLVYPGHLLLIWLISRVLL